MRKGYISFYDHGRRFKNGNLNIRFSPYELEKIAAGTFSDIECLSWALEEMDSYFVGEEFCLSNYAMGAMVYNDYDDVYYIFNFAELEELKNGKTVKFIAQKPDEDIREMIKEWGER